MCKSLMGSVQGALCLHLQGRAVIEVFSTPLELHEPEDGGRYALLSDGDTF